MSPDAKPNPASPGPSSQPVPSLADRLVAIVLSAAMFAAVVVAIVVIWGQGTAVERLKLATGYALLIFLFFLAAVVLLDIIRNKINLSEMLEELSGGASMSRFQLLVFTFVIAFSFFVVVLNNKGGGFPDIPVSVLALLGVSASTYAVSKGMQVSSGETDASSDDATDDQTTTKPKT